MMAVFATHVGSPVLAVFRAPAPPAQSDGGRFGRGAQSPSEAKFADALVAGSE
jgi:hypothetical protein